MGTNGTWRRGEYRCETAGCNSPALVAVQVQLSTSGGRKGRVQVRASSVRLCNGCLDQLGCGITPMALRLALGKAARTIREGK